MTITVNGEEIDPKLIEEEYERLKPQYEDYVSEQEEAADEGQLMEWCRENLIERTLLKQEAMASDIKIAIKDVKEGCKDLAESCPDMSEDEIKAFVETQLRIEQLILDITSDVKEADEAELKEYYESNKEMFDVPDSVRASHIVKHVQDPAGQAAAFTEMSNISERLKKGEAFDDIASENSDCPDNAGDLGYFSRGEMVEEFEKVVFGMDIGDVSDVFRTQFGFHIVKLTDKREGGIAPFDEVSSYISEQLSEEARSKAVEDHLDGLKNKAEIVES